MARGVAEEDGASNDYMREIVIMKKICHPNVVKLYEVIDDPSTDKMFMGMQRMLKCCSALTVSSERFNRHSFLFCLQLWNMLRRVRS